MTVISHGMDLVECRRIAQVLERHGERFLQRVLTPRERAYVRDKRNQIPHIAGRFAAKEAILKVIGTGWRGAISWQDMEIVNGPSGQPSVTLTGESARVAGKLGVKRVLISITHTLEYAAASAIGVGD